MLEKQKRRRIDKQDDTRPDNIEQLIEKYGLEDLWDYLDKIVDYSNTKVDESIVDKIYPIGSIYMSVNNAAPSDLFGGTWQQIEDKFLLACGSTYNNGDTGGNSIHNHGTSSMVAGLNAFESSERLYFDYTSRRLSEGYTENTRVYASSGSKEASHSEGSTSGLAIYGTTDNSSNLPPYLAVYMWKRIS